MFKEIGQMASLFRQLPKLKEEMEKFQEKVSQIQAEGSAGGDMVVVKVSGRNEVLSCRISPEAMALNDREMLEDLVRVAMNQALQRVRQLLHEETQQVASGFGLPTGASLPGF